MVLPWQNSVTDVCAGLTVAKTCFIFLMSALVPISVVNILEIENTKFMIRGGGGGGAIKQVNI